MRLVEAIVDANQRAVSGDTEAGLRLEEFADSLPIIALTCIDPRLNPLLPQVLGVPADKFIWLRNAGNIIFDSMSSMTRTLALACAVKGGKEITIIGHTDCLVRKTTVLDLTSRFQALGIERSKLPDNLNEFFGLFASERQNVIHSVDFIRRSPLIGPKIPVHGLMLDIENGRLEWVVNGYESFATSASPITNTAGPMPAPSIGTPSPVADFNKPISGFNPSELKFPEVKIGEVVTSAQHTVTSAEKLASEIKQHEFRKAWETGKEIIGEVKSTSAQAKEVVQEVKEVAQVLKNTPPGQLAAELARVIYATSRYKVIGGDQKQYGPIPGAKLLEWLADGRIDDQTPVQLEGSPVWQRLADLAKKAAKPPAIPTPPDLPASVFGQKRKR